MLVSRNCEGLVVGEEVIRVLEDGLSVSLSAYKGIDKIFKGIANIGNFLVAYFCVTSEVIGSRSMDMHSVIGMA